MELCLKRQLICGTRSSEATKWILKTKKGPDALDQVAVVNAVEAHPWMTTRMLAEDFECSHTEIVKILHDAG